MRGLALSNRRRQLTDPDGYPLISLKMTCRESPNIITLRRFLVFMRCRPCSRASHSASLLVLVPSPQAKVCSTCPLGSRRIPPALATLGLPFEAPSKKKAYEFFSLSQDLNSLLDSHISHGKDLQVWAALYLKLLN